MNPEEVFRFKRFDVAQQGAGLKVNTDGVLLGAVAGAGRVRNVLDIGSGTGLIALMLAQRFPDATVHALEPEKTAYALSRYNFSRSPWAERMKVFRTELQKFRPPVRYDLMVSNPPFSGEAHGEARNRARNPVFLPLEEIFRFSRQFLEANGLLWIIWPWIGKYELLDAAYRNEMFPVRSMEIREAKNKPIKRGIWVFSREHKRDFEQDTLILTDESGQKTEEFAKLVSDFYL